MDAPDVPQKLLYHNLGELDFLNRHFGGHSISLEGIKQLMTDPKKTYHIVDFGCGGGGILKHLARWARAESRKVKLTGVDINPIAIDYLTNNCSAYPEIEGVVSNYKNYLTSVSGVDIVHCSLFCHHLEEDELIDLFRDLNKYTCGFVINDLQRSRIAYWGAWLMPRLLNGTYLSRHDGPVSVQKAFTRDELVNLLHVAGVKNATVNCRWAFRYLVIAKTNHNGSH